MIDRPAFAEKISNAFIARDIGRNARRTDFICGGLQPLGIAGRYHDVSALSLGKFCGRKTDAG